MTDYKNYLVPDRECGACTECCTHLAIVAMDKYAGVTCQHCVAGSGCGIYTARPPVCQDYHCVWRRMPALDDRWRPDLSGVMIMWGSPPPGFPTDHAVELVVIGPVETIFTDAFAGLATGFIVQQVATFLQIPRGVGYLSTTAYINELLTPAIIARSRSQAKDLLRAAYAEMMARPPKPVTDEMVAASA